MTEPVRKVALRFGCLIPLGTALLLLVILPFEGSGLRKSVEILTCVSPQFPIDLIARRPDDTQRRHGECDPLIRQAIDRGRVLYER